MVGTVTLTSAMRANLLSLQSTADLLSTTQLRLSTGRKVNSALDNPTAFFAAQALTNRASDVSSLLDGMGQSIQVLKAADQGIESLTSLVNQAKSIANAARAKIGATAIGGTDTSTYLDTLSQFDLTDTNGTASATADDSFSLQAGASGAVHTFTITAGMTAQDLVDAVNQVSGFTATLVAGTGADLGKSAIKLQASDNTKSLIIADVTGTAGTDLGFAPATYAVGAGTPADITAEQDQYDELITQIDNMIVDTGYQGTNLLNGDTLTTQFNAENTTSQTITGAAMDSTGLALDADSSSWSSTANIDTSLDKITDALATLRDEAARYGNNLSVIQTRQDFASNLINVLREGADKLTIADKNEEGANMLALQTSQQIGIQALSLASQANQSVLRLFQ